MIKKVVKKDVQLLAQSIVNIDAMFSFHKLNGEQILFSNTLKKTINQPDDLCLFREIPEVLFDDYAVIEQIKKIRKITWLGKSGVKYFNGVSKIGYSYSAFLKFQPIRVGNKLAGVFFDFSSIVPDFIPGIDNQDVLLQWINHPDILHQSLLENSAKCKAFHLYGTVIKLSEIEVRCLYFLLMGYEYSEIGVELKAMNSTVNKICTDVLAKFQVKSVAGLMQLLFSGKLLESYGLDQQKVFSKQFMSKMKQLMIC